MLKENRMSFRHTPRLAGLALLLGLSLLLAGCAAPAQPPPPNPTVIIVQYITQVVATVTPAPPVTPLPPPPTRTPARPVGFDPYSVQAYYPIAGCPMASRLHVGDIAFVATGGEQFGIHVSRDIGFSPIQRKLQPGELLYIIDNPTCNKNGLVWGVLADADNAKGFVIEGNGETYWILPYGETYDQKEIRDRLKKLP
jgi:hypothetical protein